MIWEDCTCGNASWRTAWRHRRGCPLRTFAYAPNGKRLAFIRSDKPAEAMALALKAQKNNDTELFARLPEIIQEMGGKYTFVGWMSADGKKVLDSDGGNPRDPQPGDSIVSSDALVDPKAAS